jgi:16S rRNA (cytidine1402-2'-O)-methyltransferase
MLKRTLVIYESPFRVIALLANVEQALGPKPQVCVARELTKIHEEWLLGSLPEVRAALSSREKLLGEFVVMIHPEEEPAHAAN